MIYLRSASGLEEETIEQEIRDRREPERPSKLSNEQLEEFQIVVD